MLGHGANQQWGIEPLPHFEYIFVIKCWKYPFFVPMTCLEGYFIEPQQFTDKSSLAEAVVRADNKGAIASFSPTGLGLATGHDKLERGLFRAAFFDYLNMLGPATPRRNLK